MSYNRRVIIADDVKPEILDPRVRRTRKSLEEALNTLLESKAFDRITVSDISDAAAVNRVTFYAHFVDKFELLESLVASQFESLLELRQVKFDGTCVRALGRITLAVCDFLALRPCCGEQRQLNQHLEFAVVAIVRKMMLCGLRSREGLDDPTREMLSSAVAGALYNAAKQWMRDPNGRSSEAAAGAITEIVLPLLTATW